MKPIRAITFLAIAAISLRATLVAETPEQKIKANTSLAARSHLEYQLILNKTQTAAFESNAPDLHDFASQNKIFADIAGPPAPGATATGEQALRAKMLTEIKASSIALHDKFALAQVFNGVADFALTTAVNFPGFKTVADHASLISQVVGLLGGIAAAAVSSTNNPKGASLSAGLAALSLGAGGLAGSKGQTSTLETAFNGLNSAIADVTILNYLNQDLALVKSGFADALNQSSALATVLGPLDVTQVQEQQAITYANQYVQMMKSIDGFYDVSLVNFKAAMQSQQANPAFNQTSGPKFTDRINDVDGAQSAWSTARSVHDVATSDAQSYVAMTSSSQ